MNNVTYLDNTKVTVRANKLNTDSQNKIKGYNEGYRTAKEQFEKNGISRENMLYIACHSTLASPAFYDGMIGFLAPRTVFFSFIESE